MKSKKFLLIGLFVAGLAASAFATYEYFNASAGTECCFPGCCAGSQSAECCKAE
jgi:hypothetical protein